MERISIRNDAAYSYILSNSRKISRIASALGGSTSIFRPIIVLTVPDPTNIASHNFVERVL